MRPTAFALAALLATVGLPALAPLAQDANTPAAEAAAVSPAVQAFVAQMAAATPETQAAMIRTFLANNPGTGVSLVQAVQASNPEMAKSVFDMVVAILAETDSTTGEAETLTNAFPQLVAAVDSTVEPAAGETATPQTPSFEATDETAAEDTLVEQENPGQLSNGDAVSPN
jgi:hypothetical protein